MEELLSGFGAIACYGGARAKFCVPMLYNGCMGQRARSNREKNHLQRAQSLPRSLSVSDNRANGNDANPSPITSGRVGLAVRCRAVQVNSTSPRGTAEQADSTATQVARPPGIVRAPRFNAQVVRPAPWSESSSVLRGQRLTSCCLHSSSYVTLPPLEWPAPRTCGT